MAAGLGCPCTPGQVMGGDVLGSRALEEELRRNLQREGARLEQMRAQMLRNQEVLLELENVTANLLARLRGSAVPGQVPAWRWAGHGPGGAWCCTGTAR